MAEAAVEELTRTLTATLKPAEASCPMSLDAFSTIVRPVVSEKSTVLGDQGKYIFEVAPTANKIQIKHAVEAAFANKKVPGHRRQHPARARANSVDAAVGRHDPLVEKSHRHSESRTTA